MAIMNIIFTDHKYYNHKAEKSFSSTSIVQLLV